MERTNITLRRVIGMVNALLNDGRPYTFDQKQKITKALLLLTEVQDERSNE